MSRSTGAVPLELHGLGHSWYGLSSHETWAPSVASKSLAWGDRNTHGDLTVTWGCNK